MNKQSRFVTLLSLFGWLYIGIIIIATVVSMIAIYFAFKQFPYTKMIGVEFSQIKTGIQQLLWGCAIVGGAKILMLLKPGWLKKRLDS